jgi:UDP-N-acetylmuramoyl-tripeptide--D-alanyl-D-alanine ligase
LRGSNGKTATKEHLAAALRRRFKLIKSPGNFNNHIGIPLTLLEISPETELAIVEMGANQPGDIAQLTSIAKPDYGIVLNVGPAHLQGFGDLAGVMKEKETLLRSLPSTGTAFINSDDPHVRKMNTTADTLICFGFDAERAAEQCDKMICAEELPSTAEGKGRFKLRNTEFTLNWYGRHQINNALAAASIADRFGVPLNDIARAFADLPSVEGRMEVDEFGGVLVINDAYNANLVSSEAALEFLDSLNVSGRRFAVFGDHLELGKASAEEHRLIGKLLATSNLDGLFLVGPEMKYAQGQIPDRVLYYQKDSMDITLLVNEIIQTVRTGDAILLKASHGMGFERIHSRIKRYLTEEQS